MVLEWLVIVLLFLVIGVFFALFGLIGVIGNYNEDMERRFRELERASKVRENIEAEKTIYDCPICKTRFCGTSKGKVKTVICPACKHDITEVLNDLKR